MRPRDWWAASAAGHVGKPQVTVDSLIILRHRIVWLLSLMHLNRGEG
jgi:hypothetical protein